MISRSRFFLPYVKRHSQTKNFLNTTTSTRYFSNNGLFARNSIVRQKMTRDFKIFGVFMMGCGVAYLYLKSRNETMSTRTKALLESAREKKERRQTRDSIALYEQALSVMKEENAHLAQAKVCSEIAQVHRDNGYMEKSEIAYKEALDHLDEVDHWKSAHIEGTLSLDAGAVWNELASIAKSSEEIESRYLRALSLTLTKSQMDNVNAHINKSDPSSQDFPNRANAIQAAGILYNLGCHYAETGQLRSAESVLLRSQALIEISGEYRDGRTEEISTLLSEVREALSA